MKKESGASQPHAERKALPLPVRLLAAAAVCAALCAAFWLFWGRGGGSNTWGEETPYPYSWHTERGGSVALSLKNDPQSGCKWQVEDSGGGILAIERRGEEGGRNTTFLLTPQAPGLTMVTFVYQSAEDEGDQRFVWEVPARVNASGELALEPGTAQELGGVQEGTPAGRCRITWKQERDGSLSILLTDEDGAHYSWAVEYDTALLKVSAPIRGPEGCTVTVRASGYGETAVVLTGTPAAEGEARVRYTVELRAAAQSVLLTGQSGEEIS